MRIRTTLAMAVVMSVAAQAEQAITRTVTVCTEGVADFRVAATGQMIASKMLATAGVKIVWRQGLERCPEQGILITMSDRTPPSVHPGAMAYAMPYEGAHIRLLYDRIALCEVKLRPHVLAHVLAHEITHILQGVAGHADAGVMKAHWNQDDYSAMLRKPLTFTNGDIDMIAVGLAARDARQLATVATATAGK